MALLESMSPAEIYDLVAGFLKRVQPDSPPYPGRRGKDPRKRPFQSESDAGVAFSDTSPGGPPPEGPLDSGLPGTNDDVPPDDPDFPNAPPGGNPWDPPDDPHLPDDDPGRNDHWWVDHDSPLHGGDGDSDSTPTQHVYTRPDQFNFTDTFDAPGVGAWWTQFIGTWAINNTTHSLAISAAPGAQVPKACILYNPVDFSSPCTIDATLDNVTTGAVRYAILFGADDGTGKLNGYAFRLTGDGTLNQCAIGRFNSGVFTVIGAPFTQAFAAGDSFGLKLSGGNLIPRRNGAAIAGGTRADPGTFTSGKMGLGGNSTVPAFRDATVANS